MKRFVAIAGLILLLSALIPTVTGIDSNSNINNILWDNNSKTTSTNDETHSTEAEITISTEHCTYDLKTTEIFICEAMQYTDKDSTLETKKAIISLVKNNHRYFEGNNCDPPQSQISNYDDEFFEEMTTLYDQTNTEILYKGETVYIPLTKYSEKATATSDEFPYLSSVASPWDSFSTGFNAEEDYPCGVSIYGINFLCNNGMSYIDALRWYLPMFEIKENHAS